MSKVNAEISKKELNQEIEARKYCFLDKTRVCNNSCIAYCFFCHEKCLILYILVEISNAIMDMKLREE